MLILSLAALSQVELRTSGVTNSVLGQRVFSTVQKHCAGCHGAANSSLFSLRTRDSLVRYARGMAGEVLERRMPPGLVESDFGSFCATGAMTPEEISGLWEWSNRVEQNAVSASDLPASPMRFEGNLRPIPTLSLPIKFSIPEEGPDGLHVVTPTFSIPTKYQHRGIMRFWVDSSLQSRLISAVLRGNSGDRSFLVGWSLGIRNWSFARDSPKLPAQIRGQITTITDGRTRVAEATLNFQLRPPAKPHSPSRKWRILTQQLNQTGTKIDDVQTPGLVYGVVPMLGGHVESWQLRLWTATTGWKTVAGQVAATSRSVGAFCPTTPISIKPTDKLELQAQYRRGRSGPVSADWLIAERR